MVRQCVTYLARGLLSSRRNLPQRGSGSDLGTQLIATVQSSNFQVQRRSNNSAATIWCKGAHLHDLLNWLVPVIVRSHAVFNEANNLTFLVYVTAVEKKCLSSAFLEPRSLILNEFFTSFFIVFRWKSRKRMSSVDHLGCSWNDAARQTKDYVKSSLLNLLDSASPK